ncbi:hypothetical protein DPMN_060676 [Dreissena polymorpha]|uniref:Uncharacterized protein n=1 Tax=Dreissena polymorpha TaxID=45954 RepID=A0A9D4C620_DREPO|nr:hypothetical protein DPMN_060676 [Dreissena polymorpha]
MRFILQPKSQSQSVLLFVLATEARYVALIGGLTSTGIRAAHSEVTALTVPSNAIAVWAYAIVLRVHVEMGVVKTDGKE